MTQVLPSTAEVTANLVAQLETELAQTVPWLPKNALRVLCKAIAGVFTLLYKYLGYMTLQQFVKTAQYADTDVNGRKLNPLLFWGQLIGVGPPAAATNAVLTIDVTVTTQTGQLNVNTQLRNASNGVTYLTLASVLLNAATVSVQVRASQDTAGGRGEGVVGNLNPGAVVTFVNPQSNVSQATTVTSQDTTGANAEAVEVYRQRIIDRFQKRPEGGAPADYEAWGEELTGIVSVYPYTSPCPGQVDLYVEATPASSGSPDGNPTTAQLQAVQDATQLNVSGLASRRPIGALVNTFSINRLPFNVQIVSLVADDLATLTSQIQQAVDEYMAGREPFIPGLSALPRKDRVTQTALGGIVEDLVSAAGGTFTAVRLLSGTTVVPVYTLGAGEKAKTGAISYV